MACAVVRSAARPRVNAPAYVFCLPPKRRSVPFGCPLGSLRRRGGGSDAFQFHAVIRAVSPKRLSRTPAPRYEPRAARWAPATHALGGPRDQLFQFSLRSRCTATLAGLRTLIQTRQRPGPRF